MTVKKIYLIQKENSNFYKIGYSKNPKQRLKQLQTANDCNLILLKEYETSIYNKLERFLHSHFMLNKIQGEWFELNNEDVEEFETTCKEKEELLKFLQKNNYFYDSI